MPPHHRQIRRENGKKPLKLTINADPDIFNTHTRRELLLPCIMRGNWYRFKLKKETGILKVMSISDIQHELGLITGTGHSFSLRSIDDLRDKIMREEV